VTTTNIAGPASVRIETRRFSDLDGADCVLHTETAVAKEAAYRHNWATDAPVKRSLIAYDH
jgi:hypothetical protein